MFYDVLVSCFVYFISILEVECLGLKGNGQRHVPGFFPQLFVVC